MTRTAHSIAHPEVRIVSQTDDAELIESISGVLPERIEELKVA